MPRRLTPDERTDRLFRDMLVRRRKALEGNTRIRRIPTSLELDTWYTLVERPSSLTRALLALFDTRTWMLRREVP